MVLTADEDRLRIADRIILVDPNRPHWYQPLYVSFVLRNPITIQIPVDSTDSAAIDDWRSRIAALRLDD